MINCENCLKNDVCGKRENSNVMAKDLELNPLVQALRSSGFKFDLECVNYTQVQAAKILGGNYEQ